MCLVENLKHFLTIRKTSVSYCADETIFQNNAFRIGYLLSPLKFHRT